MSAAESKQRRGPLAGLRVVELGTLIAGPFASRLLADYGAHVIKIEAPDAPDPMRDWGQVTFSEEDWHLWWAVQSRNKELITLNLRHPKGQELFRRLISHVDILIENFRPGTMEKWGLGYDDLHQIHPGLVMVRVSGFGQTGPYHDRAGFGSVAEAMGGIRYLNGFADRPPTRFGISLGDALGSLYAVIGGLAAIQARHLTGQGQMVDCAITEAAFSLLESAVPEYGLTGHIRERQGNILPGIAPSNTYSTRDGQFIVIGANQDRVFRRLSEVMGQPQLAEDPRYSTHVARGENQASLDAVVESWTIQYDLTDIAQRLNQAGIPAGPIFSIEDIFSDPHFQSRDMIVTVEDPQWGSVPIPGVVPKFSDTPGEVRHLGRHDLGSDNVKVYAEWLGLTTEEMLLLQEQQVI